MCISKSNLGTFLAFLHVMSLVICPVPDTNLHKWVSHKRHHFKSCWVNLGGVNLTGGSTFPGSTLLRATVTRFSYAFLISRFFLEFLHVMSLVICPVADTNLHKGAYHKYRGNLTGVRGYLARVNLVEVKLAGVNRHFSRISVCDEPSNMSSHRHESS